MKLRYKILVGLVGLIVLSFSALAITLGYTASCAPYSSANPDKPMNAIIYRCYGGPEVLEQVVVEIPKPAANQVLVKVKAAAVNPYDWHFMRGSPYFMRLISGIGKPKEIGVGADFSGVVVEVGSEITHLKPGDEVFGGGSGAYAEYTLARGDKSVAIKPANVTFEEAAGLPIAALTALQAVRDKGQLSSGQKVLINGASGGVGTYAVQIAKSVGAEVHGVCSTRNVDMVKSIGADRVFDYKSENYTQSGEKYDLILDMVSNHSISDNVAVLKDDGKLVIVGGPKGDWIGPITPFLKAIWMSNFVDQELISFTAEFNQPDLQTLAQMMQKGQLKSKIDRRYSLAKIGDAMAYSESGRARGKIIIQVE